MGALYIKYTWSIGNCAIWCNIPAPSSCRSLVAFNLNVIELYQHGSAAPGVLNPQTLYGDYDLDQTPSTCHSGLTPPPEVVYKEHGEGLEKVTLKRNGEISTCASTPLVQHFKGRSPSAENTLLELTYNPRASHYKWLQLFPCSGCCSPRSPSAALFYVSDSSSPTFTSSSPPWFPGCPWCDRLF